MVSWYRSAKRVWRSAPDFLALAGQDGKELRLYYESGWDEYETTLSLLHRLVVSKDLCGTLNQPTVSPY